MHGAHNLDGFRNAFRTLAIGVSVASAALAADFGLHQSDGWVVSLVIAAILVCFSFASDYIWLFVVQQTRARNWGMAGVLAVGGGVIFSIHLLGSIGAVGWQRDETITAAKVQNTRFDMAGDQVKDSRASLALFTKQLADLEAQNAWAAAVTADAMRAEIPVKDEAIRQEEARNGCGKKCLRLQQEKADLLKRIGIAEQRETLTKQIEATQRVLAGYRKEAAGVDRKVAAPASQAKFFASIASLSLEPSQESEVWTTRGIGSWIAVGICLAPILFGLVGWGTSTGPAGAPVGREFASGEAVALEAEPVAASAGEQIRHGLKVVQQRFDDTRFAQRAADALRQFGSPRTA